MKYLIEFFCLVALTVIESNATAGDRPWMTPTCAIRGCPQHLQIQLGRTLFVSEAIAPNGRSCATCHEPAYGWGASSSTRDKFAELPRSIPSLMNLAHQRWYFWDGRSDRLWQQALGPLENTVEMDSHRLYLVAAIFTDARLRRMAVEAGILRTTLFQQRGLRDSLLRARQFCTSTTTCELHWKSVSGTERLQIERIARNALEALEAFLLTLLSPHTRYDEFIATGQGLSPAEARGMKLFFGEARCSNCHSGPALTDNGFHNLLLPAPSGRSREDPGRYAGIEHLRRIAATGYLGYKPTELSAHLDQNYGTYGQFKTPSIRNLSGRAEFMHNGIFRSLRDVLNYYNTLAGALVVHHHPNGMLSPLNMREDQIDDLEHFLNVFNRREK